MVGISGAILALSLLSLFLLLKGKSPRPKPLFGGPGIQINSKRDSDGPYLEIKLHLENPGEVPIYIETSWPEANRLFGKKDFDVTPNATTRIVPPANLVPRPPWVDFKARPRDRIKACKVTGDVDTNLVVEYRTWIWRHHRRAKYKKKIPARTLRDIGVQVED